VRECTKGQAGSREFYSEGTVVEKASEKVMSVKDE